MLRVADCAHKMPGNRTSRITRVGANPSPSRGEPRVRIHFPPAASQQRTVSMPRTRPRCGYSAHSMRATPHHNGARNGAQLENVQKAAEHPDPSTTKQYDRRSYNPEKAASRFIQRHPPEAESRRPSPSEDKLIHSNSIKR